MDNGSEFTNKYVDNLLEEEQNALSSMMNVERSNRSIRDKVSK
jgi:hypothetical protein